MKIKRLLAATMAVVMLVSGLSLSAFACETDEPATYNYVALGDSIASGYGLAEKPEGTIDPALILSEDLIANPVEEAYAAVFGEFIEKMGDKYGYETNTTNLSSTAYRAQDVAQTILESGTKGEIAAWILDTFVGEGTSDVLLNYHDIYSEYLPEADLVSIGLGGNDVIMAAMYPMIESGNPVLISLAVSVALVLFGYDAEEALGAGVMLLVEKKDEITVQDFTEAAAYISTVMNSFDSYVDDAAANVAEVVDAVRTVNSDADVVLIGMFNPYGNSLKYDGQVRNICNVTKNIFVRALELMCESEDASITDTQKQLLSIVADEAAYPLQYKLLGENVAPYVKNLNSQLEDLADETGCYYVDVYNISNECNLDPHPTASGHKEIAEILKASLYNVVVSDMGGHEHHCHHGRYNYGDIDMDDEISIVDVANVQRCLAKMFRFSALQMYLADTDGDDEMSIMDVSAMQMYLAEIYCDSHRVHTPYGHGHHGDLHQPH